MDSEYDMADGLIKAEQWKEIAKLYGSGGIPMPVVQEIFLLECEIAGTGFIKEIEKRAGALSEGSIVSLVREPENKYDDLAIRVDNPAGEKLGYIPRRKNEILARLLDGGKMLYGKVSETDISGDGGWVEIFIQIYMKEL